MRTLMWPCNYQGLRVLAIRAHLCRSQLAGKGEGTMCQACQKPEKLKDKPENCSPEQIKKCHGDAIGHPCLSLAEEPEHSKG
jgi:hypothetical protein